jgi:hypothetical protein
MLRGLQGIVLAAIIIGSGCASEPAARKECTKFSGSLVYQMSIVHDSTEAIEVLLYLNDSTGIRDAFPNISVSTATIATARLTVAELEMICSLPQIRYIEKSRKLRLLDQ